MRRFAGTAAVLTAIAFAAPVPRADAAPAVATLALDIRIGCYGCGTYGPEGNTIRGTVLAGAGPLRTGAVVTGSITVHEPGGRACGTRGTAEGTLSADGYSLAFRWSRIGGTILVTTPDGTGAGTFAVTPPGVCGGPVGVAVEAPVLYNDAIFQPFPVFDATSVYGHITVSDDGTGTGPTLFTAGMFALDPSLSCDVFSETSGELLASCEANGRLPLWPCQTMHAASWVYPWPSHIAQDPTGPAYWGGNVSTTAMCYQQGTASVAAADATVSQPATYTSGPGTGSMYRFDCRLKLSGTGPVAAPRAPYVAMCWVLP